MASNKEIDLIKKRKLKRYMLFKIVVILIVTLSLLFWQQTDFIKIMRIFFIGATSLTLLIDYSDYKNLV